MTTIILRPDPKRLERYYLSVLDFTGDEKPFGWCQPDERGWVSHRGERAPNREALVARVAECFGLFRPYHLEVLAARVFSGGALRPRRRRFTCPR